jgi:RNA polymerase sigma factor (sigma-70 family)
MVDFFKSIPSADIDNTNDQALWREFKSGNQLAFSTIYDSHVGQLYKYGKQLTKDLQLVEDCIQDLFVKLWHSRMQLSDIVNIRFYLIKAFRRELISKIRKSTKYQSLEDYQEYDKDKDVFDPFDDPEQKEQSLQIKIKTIVNKLDGRQREVVFLRFFQNMTFEQISKVLDIDLKYTYNLSSKAIASIRSELKKDKYFFEL